MKAEPSLIESWERQPDEQHRLLVRVVGGLGAAEQALQGADVQVRRCCKLVNGLVVTCAGGQALLLIEQDWVSSIETDAPIHEMLAARPCV